LSGGNQQKVLLAKWLATKPSVLILDEPTRGVDVGAKAQIHEIIRELAASGMAILVISSEMAEVLTLADRVLVMRQGAISGELSRAEADQARLLELSLPVANDAAPEVAVVRSRRLPAEATVAALLAAVLVGVSIANPTFMAMGNLRDMLIKVSPAVIVGSVLTLVVLAREIDISVGSLMGLCAAVLGITCSPDRMGLPVPVGISLCLATGLVAGVTNGLLVAWARIPSIIVTLAMLTVLRGVTEKAMGGKWIENLPAGLRQFGTGSLAGIPIVVLVAVMSAAGAMWLAGRTRFGRQLYAIGSNPEAATLRGVKTGSVRIALFALTGLAAATAALVSATQLQVIESGFGNGFELVAVASVIVGGTSIRGGRGSVTGTILGATLLGIISTALIFLRLGESAVYWERAIQGGLILLAILVDHWQRKGRGAGAV
jgi:ribose/xylose/arabinose/galactoside ABC-type transport system permease subunit